MNPKHERIVGAVLCALAVGMVLYRFMNLDLASFINDEPAELDLARQHLKSGETVTHNPTSGSQGVRYGPTTIWLNQVVQIVANPAPETAIVAFCLLMTLAHVAFAAALARAFKGGLIVFASALAWMAASPYQFFWSRLAWDPVNTFVLYLLALVIAIREVNWRWAIALGLVAGLMFSLHLLTIPLIGIVVVLLAFELRKRPLEIVKCVAIAGAVAAVVNIPYLSYLLKQPSFPAQPTAFVFDNLTGNGLWGFRLGTWSGIDSIFDHEWPAFRVWLGGMTSLLDASVPLAMGLGILLALAGIAVAMRSSETQERRAAALAIAVLAIYPAFYTWRGVGLMPHYHYVTWWVVPFGIASVVAWLKTRWAWPTRGALVVVWLVALFHFACIVSWMKWIRERGGTTGIHYSTPIGLQRDAIRTACSRPLPAVYIRNETAMYDHTVQYVVSVEPACAGKQVIVGRGATSDGSMVRLMYVNPAGGGAVTTQ